jgi:hypothetical protein
MNENIEKRRYTRTDIEGYIADIADGHVVYAGAVENVSLDGLRLNELPEKFSAIGKKYMVIVSGEMNSDCFKLKVISRWRKKNSFTVDVGFSILDAPTGWRSFVQKISPVQRQHTDDDDSDFWHTGSNRD